jgi:hypothetical protein
VNVWPGFLEVLVPPSPKFHDHEVGAPAEVSVNVTDCPAAGEDGLKVKEALSVGTGLTETTTLAELVPAAWVMVKTTVYVPDAVNAWLGLRVALVDPSLKSQSQAVGVPVEVSVNATACPATGEAGL